MGVGAVKESAVRARWIGSLSPREAKLSVVVVGISVHAAQMLFGAVRVRAPRAMRSGTGKKKIVRKKMKPQAAPLSRMQPSDEDHRSRISRTITAP
jgi:hypothetical protein